MAVAAAGRVLAHIPPHDALEVQLSKISQSRLSALVTSADHWEELRPESGELASVVVGGGGSIRFEDAVTAGATDPAELQRTKPSEPFTFAYSGGTSGRPKAILRNHVQELAMIRDLLLEAISPGVGKAFVAATPLSHAAGAFVFPTVLVGGCLSWIERFDPERIVNNSWLPGRPKIQTFLVPTALADVADAAHSDHALDTVVYGGAPCSKQVLVRAVAQLGTCLVQVYGQAEAPMTICVLSKEQHADVTTIAGSAGVPCVFTDVRIVKDGRVVSQGEVGEVVVRSDHVMSGYWEDPAATTAVLDADGSLHTQDLAYFDDAGRVWIVGRVREMIISGGTNVFPEEVERRLGAIAGARQIVLFGVPHVRWGQAVVAAVVAESGADTQGLVRRIEEVARARLGAHERPKRTVFVEDIPLTAIGKVSRKVLADRFANVFSDQSPVQQH